MTSKNRCWLIAILSAMFTAASISGCGSGTPPPPVSVSVSPSTTQSVDEGQTASFTATVVNDASNKGVTWAVSCATVPCGSVSPTATASGASTTYTAPSSVAANLNVTVTATSVADGSKSAPGAVTVMALSVTVSPSTPRTVNLGQNLNVSATVANDASNKGVTWTVSCVTAPCGTVSPATTASGAATNYTAPSAPPAGNLSVSLTATSVTDGTKTASATITVPGIVISISPSGPSVESGGTQQFTATVSGDPSKGGVTWSMLKRICHLGNPTGCEFFSCSTCGTVSPTNTASGAATTYTAPAKPVGFGGVFVQANSVTNTGAVTSTSISILPISVSVSPTPATVALATKQQFAATVTNDGTKSGVTWTLTQNGVACSPACGTIAPATTASGAAGTYTAPGTAPVVPVVTVNATSVEDTTKSSAASVILTTSSGGLPCGAGSGNESVLKGQYAFSLEGIDPRGHMSIGASIAADGTGRITGGEEDIELGNGTSPGGSINATTSRYAVGPDHRGCLLVNDANGDTAFFRLALGSTNSNGIATAGHIVEFGDTTGTGTRAVGTIRQQDPTAFVASQFKGNYAFGLVGGNSSWGRIAIAGNLAADGVSTITSSSFDIDVGGTLTSSASAVGNFTCCSANGRGTMHINIGTPNPMSDFDVYVINSGEAFLIGHQWGGGGEAIGIPSGTTFTQASLNGASILRKTAQSSNGPVVDIATASADGKGALTVNDNENNAGTFKTSSTALNYVVASNGRVPLSGGSNPPVLYLYGPNQGFLVGTDPDVTFGILEPQAAGPFSDASFSGAYMFGTANPSASTVTLESGIVTADGKGNAAGTSDQSSSTDLAQNQSLNFTYSFPANGVGNVGSGTTAILISGNKLVFINNTSANPTITIVEK
jgi:hypothetical protein